MFIDTHCHLNFKDFREDADEVIKRTLEEDIQLINIGSQYSTSKRAIKYAEKYNQDGRGGVWAVVGIHPVHLFNSAGGDDKDFPKKVSLEVFDYEKYLELAKNDKVVAIGEVGLDYHHFATATRHAPVKDLSAQGGSALGGQIKRNNKIAGKNFELEKCKKEVGEIIELQKKVFKEFIELANEVDKPLVIHGWNADKKDKELVGGAVAYEDILEIVRSSGPMVHSSQFTVHGDDKKSEIVNIQNVNTINNKDNKSYNDDMLNGSLRTVNCEPKTKLRGVVHSFIGNYKMAWKFIEEGFLIGLNGIITYSESYDRLIKEIGLENIIIETDAPYLTPAPLERYSRNEPLNVKLVAQKIADVLQVDISEVEKTTTENAKQLFNI